MLSQWKLTKLTNKSSRVKVNYGKGTTAAINLNTGVTYTL